MPEPYFEPHIAIAKIRTILSTGRLVITDHCYERMEERNVDKLDIVKVLKDNGTINSQPEWSNDHQRYKYQVDGKDIEGDELTVFVNIVEDDKSVVTITVF